jgi:hypothetical protein
VFLRGFGGGEVGVDELDGEGAWDFLAWVGEGEAFGGIAEVDADFAFGEEVEEDADEVGVGGAEVE